MRAEERRADRRMATRFESLISTGREEGTGILANISYSGAEIEGASLLPQVGKEMRIWVLMEPLAPFPLNGTVVRHTSSGFALAISKLDDDLKSLVDEVASIVDGGDTDWSGPEGMRWQRQ